MLARLVTIGLYLAVGCSVGACRAPAGGDGAEELAEDSTMDGPEAPWTVVYSDGSANIFTFTRPSAVGAVHVAYEPVTPERSSTGAYSGGTRREGTLDADATRRLWALLGRLEAAQDDHVAQREKGTGAFALTVGAGTRHFVVGPGARLDEFQAFVAPLRGH